MCLDIKYFNPPVQTAEEDIKVFKVAVRSTMYLSARYSGYYAPFRDNYEYILDTPITSGLTSEWAYGHTSIHEGLHSLATKEDAQLIEDYLHKFGDQTFEYVTLEATIPKGAKYYAGTFKIGGYFGVEAIITQSFASDTLIIHSPEGFTHVS